MRSERVEIIPNVWCGAIFVAGAGSREVASCGGGECRCDIGFGVGGCCLGLESRNCLAGLPARLR